MQKSFKRLPQHIAVIPDGNRRWAVSRSMKKSEGYPPGVDAGLRLFEQCKKLGIKELTLYGFTNDNMKRPQEETIAFRSACVAAVDQVKDKDADILVVGNSESKIFPEELLPFTTRKKSGRSSIKINFLVNYDWHWDIKNAVANTKGGARSDLLEGAGSAEVSRIDLIVRWGGRRRLSGMLPLQSVYADFFVVDDYWPDFEESHLEAALKWYDEQDITLGG